MHFRRTSVGLLVLMVLAALALPAFGQETTSGQIEGKVTDDKGQSVPGATISVTGAQGLQAARTGNDGRFSIPFLKGGWSGFWKFMLLLKLASLAGLFLMLLLITALIPRRLSVIAAAFPNRWPMSILVGLVACCATFVLCFASLAFAADTAAPARKPG